VEVGLRSPRLVMHSEVQRPVVTVKELPMVTPKNNSGGYLVHRTGPGQYTVLDVTTRHCIGTIEAVDAGFRCTLFLVAVRTVKLPIERTVRKAVDAIVQAYKKQDGS
jgi:hypothetical protein